MAVSFYHTGSRTSCHKIVFDYKALYIADGEFGELVFSFQSIYIMKVISINVVFEQQIESSYARDFYKLATYNF